MQPELWRAAIAKMQRAALVERESRLPKCYAAVSLVQEDFNGLRGLIAWAGLVAWDRLQYAFRQKTLCEVISTLNEVKESYQNHPAKDHPEKTREVIKAIKDVMDILEPYAIDECFKEFARLLEPDLIADATAATERKKRSRVGDSEVVSTQRRVAAYARTHVVFAATGGSPGDADMINGPGC